MSLSEARLGGNATGLPALMPLPSLTSALSRRAALFGVVTVTGASVAALPAKAEASTLSANDRRLVSMAADLRTILNGQATLTKGDRRDCDEIPGFLALEERRSAISDALFDLRPDSMAGLMAAADIVQQLSEETFNGGEDQTGHGYNLACDVLRIIGGVS